MQLNKLNKRYIQLDIVRRNMETDINLGRYKTDIMCGKGQIQIKTMINRLQNAAGGRGDFGANTITIKA